jgi:hypothetical protein
MADMQFIADLNEGFFSFILSIMVYHLNKLIFNLFRKIDEENE